jgi:hypothetical protein
MKTHLKVDMHSACASSVSRRGFLRGLGTCLALPVLESAMRSSAQAGQVVAPRRMAFVSIPNGVHQEAWCPTKRAWIFR